MQLLKEHKKENEKDLMQHHLDTSQTLLSLSSAGTGSLHFTKQDLMLTSIVRNVVGAGGMKLQVVEQGWFRQFIHDVKPRFKPVSRVAVKRKLSILNDEDGQQLQKNMSKVSFNPTVMLDFWTGHGGQSFMGCTVHFVHEGKLMQHMLFFKEYHPHIPQKILICNRFEDELDHCSVKCF